MCGECDYYRRRADEELEAATSAEHPKVRQCHLDFARAYERQARSVAAEERRSALHIVDPTA
jgi:hypothetical protein